MLRHFSKALSTDRHVMVFALCITLAACGGSKQSSTSSAIPPVVPPVQAASPTFTNANFTGSYAFGAVGSAQTISGVGTGVITADGNGNVTAGEETLFISSGGTTVSCRFTFTGAYSVMANGTGTITLNGTPDSASSAKGCTGGTSQGTLALSNGGTNVVYASGLQGVNSLATGQKQ